MSAPPPPPLPRLPAQQIVVKKPEKNEEEKKVVKKTVVSRNKNDDDETFNIPEEPQRVIHRGGVPKNPNEPDRKRAPTEVSNKTSSKEEKEEKKTIKITKIEEKEKDDFDDEFDDDKFADGWKDEPMMDLDEVLPLDSSSIGGARRSKLASKKTPSSSLWGDSSAKKKLKSDKKSEGQISYTAEDEAEEPPGLDC